MSPLTLFLVIWGVSFVLTLIGMGITEILMLDSTLSDHLSRPVRIAMLVFAPVSVVGFFAAIVFAILKGFWELLQLVTGR